MSQPITRSLDLTYGVGSYSTTVAWLRRLDSPCYHRVQNFGTMSKIDADSGDLQSEKMTKSSEKEKDHSF